jgi:hypothetical protein
MNLSDAILEIENLYDAETNSFIGTTEADAHERADKIIINQLLKIAGRDPMLVKKASKLVEVYSLLPKNY